MADDDSVPGEEASDPSDAPNCVWFFVPLPDPIGLPDGWQSIQPVTLADLVDSRRPRPFRSSLVVRQLAETESRFDREFASLEKFALTQIAPLFDHSQPDGRPTADPSAAELLDLADLPPDDVTRTSRTILEVAVAGFDGQDEISLLQALALALDHARAVQLAVATVTNRGIRLVALETLPPFIPTFRGTIPDQATESGSDLELWPRMIDSPIWQLPRSAPPTSFGLAPSPLTPEQLKGLEWVLGNTHAFEVYADLRREALMQLYSEGNPRMAVIATATAGEVLLDAALMMMLWEERVDPLVAATHFDRSVAHTKRVAREIAPRLGGGWDPASRTAAGRYLRGLVRLRHRVVHSGHSPTHTEAESGFQELIDLGHYLGDRLSDQHNLVRYTRTAWAWMGPEGLERRQALTNHVRSLTHDDTEPDWGHCFALWQARVDRAIGGVIVAAGRDGNALTLYAIASDQGITWVLHDATAQMAAVVDPTAMVITDRQQGAEKIANDLLAAKDPLPRCASAPDSPPPANLAWVADYELLPELAMFP
jgi:hypothetical protein